MSNLGKENISTDSSESTNPEVTSKRKLSEVEDEVTSEEAINQKKVKLSDTQKNEVNLSTAEIADVDDILGLDLSDPNQELLNLNGVFSSLNDAASPPLGNDLNLPDLDINGIHELFDLNYPPIHEELSADLCIPTTESESDVVNIKVQGSADFSIQILLKSTVQSLKNLIALNHNIPADEQRLIHKGRLLEDDQNLESYGLKEGDNVYLLRRSAPTNGGKNSSGTNARGAASTNAGVADGLDFIMRQFGEAFSQATAMAPITRSAGPSAPSPFPNTMPLPNPWSSTRTGDFQNDLADILNRSVMLRAACVSQMMLMVFYNSQVLSQMLHANPGQGGMIDLNSLREVLQNADFLHLASTPDTLQHFLSFQQALLYHFTQRQPTRESDQTGGDTALINMGVQLLSNIFGELGAGGSLAAPNSSNETQPPEQFYAAQLSQLQEMGFCDTQENIRALIATSGNVQAAIRRLLRGNSGQ